MSQATLLSHAELLDHLEDGTVDPEAFSHREHVRAGWAALRRYGVLTALARYSGALRALTEKVGRPERYHETITVAFLLLIHERLGPAEEDFDTFATRCPELFAKPGLLDKVYPRTVLESAVARQHFILPDVPPA